MRAPQVGAGWELCGQQALRPGPGAGLVGVGGWSGGWQRRQAQRRAVPGSCGRRGHRCLPAPSRPPCRLGLAWAPSGGRVCRGPGRSGRYRAEPWPQGQPRAVGGRAGARRGPGLSRRKTSQGLQIAALSFFPPSSCFGGGRGGEKKAALPLEADAKRMQNFNHLLHRPSFLSRVWALAWRRGTLGRERPEQPIPVLGDAGKPSLLCTSIQNGRPHSTCSRGGGWEAEGAWCLRRLHLTVPVTTQGSTPVCWPPLGVKLGVQVPDWRPQPCTGWGSWGPLTWGPTDLGPSTTLASQAFFLTNFCFKNNVERFLASGEDFTHCTFKAGLKE